MSHIFISYSTQDAEYALQVADDLRAKGYNVWIDDRRLRSSQDWWRSIVLAIWECAAFVVILSPNSDQSRWVQREVSIADDRHKPIFPLLLKGDLNTPNWQLFIRTQYEDVRDEKLPGNDFYVSLSQLIAPHNIPGRSVSTVHVPRLPPAEQAELEGEIADPPAIEENKITRFRRWGMLAGVVVAVFILTLVFQFINGLFDQQPTTTPLPLAETLDSNLTELTASDYWIQGNTKRDIGDYEGAIADHTRAIELKSELAYIYYNSRGFNYQLLEDYEAAIADYDRAIELKSDYAIAYNNRGVAYESIGNDDAAIADFNRAIQSDPAYALPNWLLGNMYYDQERYEEALNCYRRYVELATNPEQVVLDRINQLEESLGE